MHYLFEQSSPDLVVKAQLGSGFGEGLTRESRTQYLMWRNLLSEFAYVTICDTLRLGEISDIESFKLVINLRRKHALMTQLRESQVKSAKAGKEVDKSHRKASQLRGFDSAAWRPRRALTTASIAVAIFLGFLIISVSQTRITIQPCLASVLPTRLSRAMLLPIFAIQYSELALCRRLARSRFQLRPCQKSPSQKTKTRAAPNTMSGLPVM